MNAEDVFARLGLPKPSSAVSASWAQTQADFPEHIAEIDENAIRSACREIRIGADVEDALAHSLGMFSRHPELRRLLWHCRGEVRRALSDPDGFRTSWPALPATLEDARLFYAIVLLTCLPMTRAFHASRGIPADIALDTFSDMELWIRHHHRLRGSWGFLNQNWMLNHFTGRLYKLGRLQFERSPLRHDLYVYRNKKDKRVAVFAAAGLKFRGDGLFDGSNGIYDKKNGFVSEFADDGVTIRGTHIPPSGTARREPVTYPSAEWEKILQKGDPCLSIHIPAAGPLDHAECGASILRALPFWAKHFPEQHVKALVCVSWFLDPQFARCLPAQSNIVKFISECYLFPYASASDAQTFERVFDGPVDLDKAPQTSSIQRAVIQHMKAGGRWNGGGILLFPDDLRWGEQTYGALTNG